jgi:hypothetical protein
MGYRAYTLLIPAIILSKELVHSSPYIFPISILNQIYTCDSGKLADPSALLQVYYMGTIFSYKAPPN